MLKTENKFMLKAIDLAKKGRGAVSPNPLVGCVVEKRAKIVATGFHKKYGSLHAEAEALKKAGKKTKKATLYVNLEPCAHFGKTPPCVMQIINSGISCVNIGIKDPNPINNGRGIKILRKAGIKVNIGICKKKATELNLPFIKYMKKKLPFVTLKMAQSLDGKIATHNMDSKWISCEESRNLAHKMRKNSDAVMVGVGTIIKDDPLLTDRRHQTADIRPQTSGRRQPIKIIIDSMLRTPFSSRIFSKKSPAKTIIAATDLAPKHRVRKFLEKGVDVLLVSSKNKKVDLKSLMKILASRGIINILIEGGGELAASAFQEHILDKIVFFIAPKIIGGRNAKTSVEGHGVDRILKAFNVKNITVEKIGSDFLFEGYL